MFCIVIVYEQIVLTSKQKGSLWSQDNDQPFTHRIYVSKADSWVCNYELGAGLHAAQIPICSLKHCIWLILPLTAKRNLQCDVYLYFYLQSWDKHYTNRHKVRFRDDLLSSIKGFIPFFS